MSLVIYTKALKQYFYVGLHFLSRTQQLTADDIISVLFLHTFRVRAEFCRSNHEMSNVITHPKPLKNTENGIHSCNVRIINMWQQQPCCATSINCIFTFHTLWQDDRKCSYRNTSCAENCENLAEAVAALQSKTTCWQLKHTQQLLSRVQS